MTMARSVPAKFVLALISTCFLGQAASQAAEDWNRWAKEELEKTLKLEKLNTNIAKNVIVFLGDGFGISTLTSARIYKGQLEGKTGEEDSLTLETLPRSCLLKTYNTDHQVADSAGTATALLSGVKTKRGVIGVDDSVIKSNCSSTKAAEIDSIFDMALRQGKAAGIVSTARITHASPASVYAHSADREWEYSADEGCVDIAAQLVERATDFKVVLGGGRRAFMTNATEDPEDSSLKGRRTDGRDLISEWKGNLSDGFSAEYVWNKTHFDAVDPKSTDYLFGLFEYGHMEYESNRVNDTAGEPSLAEMVEKSIRMLSKNHKGFFLFVEGGRIDHAHHDNRAYDALVDAIAFDDAVKKGLEMIHRKDTLVIVTSDHGHVNTINGYPKRGNPILGKSGEIATDGLPYTTISYTNGPNGLAIQESFRMNGNRPNITDVDTEAPDYLQETLVYRAWELMVARMFPSTLTDLTLTCFKTSTSRITSLTSSSTPLVSGNTKRTANPEIKSQ
ncbi:alkaline phosphatase, tissue-nonspecific isozyme-like [Ptychodera flava]|uniref:alkaline phosphatase, tissue-nonspecific isozyme-like n=1 Tax=Ptychodera flava TaxID=63121 RepID=UPI00396A59ED